MIHEAAISYLLLHTRNLGSYSRRGPAYWWTGVGIGTAFTLHVFRDHVWSMCPYNVPNDRTLGPSAGRV